MPLRTDYAGFMPGNDDGGGQICDLGVMGCNEVPMEFRRNMQALEVGATIQFVVRDPSAKEDLPPLARMMGHRIISEEHLGDGALSIVIERAR
jgi:TusA-related sulfurtransferase